jgi:hypothetical protein
LAKSRFPSKKSHLTLDMAEQDAITPLASGENQAPKALQEELFKRSRVARIAQLVEQRIENPRVGGSNPPPGTIHFLALPLMLRVFGRLYCVRP